jgi:His/Glu/Gln/Arg/opine family amino acid ABC transporter permease subunit
MAALAYALAVVVGLVIALARTSRRRSVSIAAAWYVELIRGTPALTQLFLLYFGLASAGIILPAFAAAVVGLGLNYSAYMSEVYRAGIAAVHRGQREAALAIGMTNALAMRSIILPQAVRIIVPPMANYAVSLLKDTSVASLISAPELMLRGAISAASILCRWNSMSWRVRCISSWPIHSRRACVTWSCGWARDEWQVESEGCHDRYGGVCGDRVGGTGL